MPPRSNEFQRLMFYLQRHRAPEMAITESRMLLPKDGGSPREVDICIEGPFAGHNAVVSIECADLSRTADVTWVEKMAAKHAYLPTNVLILASASGFTADARRRAEAENIKLIALEALDDASALDLFARLQSLFGKMVSLTPTK